VEIGFRRLTAEALPLILADIEELVRCESPSLDRDAGIRSADVVARIGELRLGSRPERLGGGAHQHLRWRFGNGPGRVLVLGHHDTVWPLGSLEAHPFSTLDQIIRGPGCFDMKTGVAMAFHAVAALAETDGVIVLITGDEELGSPSSRALIEDEARGCDAVFVLEGSADGGALKTARKGVSIYQLHAIGLAAHAGLEPEAGINAAVELAHQVIAITALGDDLLGTSVTPTMLTAGTTTNTVPALGSIAVDVRMWTAAEQQRIDADIRALGPVVEGSRIEVSGGPNRPPLEETASAGLFHRAVAIADDLGLPAPRSAAVGGASDGNFTAGLGVPTLDGLGAVGGGAHADHEHVVVGEICDRTTLLAALMADVLQASHPSGTALAKEVAR
jgi:glutamate carboxypeptidase